MAIQLLGTAYRIWLARRIGAEGLGIFSMTYPIYRLLSSIATIGLPLALTKWVSEYLAAREYREINALKNWSIQVVIYTSLVSAIGLYLAAPLLSRHLFCEPRVEEAFLIIAWAIPFSALSAIIRGYYQGYSLMAPTALSETLEQFAEIGTTCLGLAFFTACFPFAPYSYPIIGLTAGEIACLVTLLCFTKRPRPVASPENTEVPVPRLEILHYSWPLLINQIVIAISSTSEGALIPRFLIQTGHTVSQSTQLLGYLNGMAAPIAYFPLILLFPLGTVLSPQVSAGTKSETYRSLRTKVRRFYLMASAVSLLFFGLILFNASGLAQGLYHTAVPIPLIKILVISMPFSALSVLNLSILAAIGATEKVLQISLWSTGLKTMLLFGTLYLGIHGAAWALVIAQIFTALTGMLELRPFFTKLDA